VSHQPPFRFGVGPAGVTPKETVGWAEVARKAESLGYSTLSVSDHMMHYGPFAAMALAAGATTTLRVGTLVLCNDFRHPAVVAREAATLDALSNGRLELGIGAGWMKADYDAISLSFDPPNLRIDRLREAVEIIRRMLSGEQCTFRGRFYTVDGLALTALGPRSAQIPLLLAGSGRKMLTLAAEVADIVGVNVNLAGGTWTSETWHTGSVDQTDEKLRVITQCSIARPRPPERQIVSHFTRITTNRAAALDEMAHAWGVPIDTAAASPHGLVGSVEHIVEQLQELRARNGFSYITVDATVMGDFAPVVARLAGQ
jgi:probable F420-dependent oxidoreductase